MKFGPVALAEAEGAILAHSLGLPNGRLKKGRVLSAEDISALAHAGILEVTVARLGEEDVPEDLAAARIAARIATGPAISVSAPFTGRVNLYAEAPGLVTIDAAQVDRLNAIDEAVTLATLAPMARVHGRQMLATVKIIPYAAPEAAIATAEALLADRPVLSLNPFRPLSASLILTRTPGMGDKVLEKGAKAVTDRLASLGLTLADRQVAAHETAAIARAFSAAAGDLVLLLTASATSDRADAGPAAVGAAGGRMLRFGMPVDPGNLLFLGNLPGGSEPPRTVIGLPGCARSPKLNGADWVLERVAAGLDPAPEDIARMGVGGLLKEIPSRPQPRAAKTAAEPGAPRRPVIAALLLAAGAARRMGGRDKLLEPVAGGVPLLTHLAREAGASSVDRVRAVLRPEDPRRAAALGGTGVTAVVNPAAAEGMGTSLATGIRGLEEDVDGALILLADMPEVTAGDLDRMIAAFDPGEGRAIIRATSASGRPGHPVLFGRRFFEPLAALTGDRGAKAILDEHPEFITDLPLAGDSALTDLDTPEAWAAWRARQKAG
ncbi:MAG: molybdopterin-binding/glycosyltransferase family 2 protein [Pseudomonadota bacterium]